MEKKIYSAIQSIQGELCSDGISKDKENKTQGYKFRGIDDILNALAPLFKKHSLFVVPRVLSRAVERAETKAGGNLFYSTVDVEFDFICSQDGSQLTARVVGEAMDSADKSTNKAMSAAMKYACILTFCIPTEGDNDADSTTHEVKPKPETKPQKLPDDSAMYQSVAKAISEATTKKRLNEIEVKMTGVMSEGNLFQESYDALTKMIKNKLTTLEQK